MKELEVYLMENEINKITSIAVYPKNYLCTGFSVLVKRDFKIESTDASYLGYFLELNEQFDLKQLKIELI